MQTPARRAFSSACSQGERKGSTGDGGEHCAPHPNGKRFLAASLPRPQGPRGTVRERRSETCLLRDLFVTETGNHSLVST